MILNLPWPPKDLNPNSRSHWGTVARAKKKYRRECYYLALGTKADPENITITFYPPRKGWDDDNAIAAFKAGRDGLADAWGIDDKHFRPRYVIGEPVKHGAVEVRA